MLTGVCSECGGQWKLWPVNWSGSARQSFEHSDCLVVREGINIDPSTSGIVPVAEMVNSIDMLSIPYPVLLRAMSLSLIESLIGPHRHAAHV